MRGGGRQVSQLPPHDIGAEEILISALLNREVDLVDVASTIDVDDLYAVHTRSIFSAIEKCETDNVEVSAAGVISVLNRSGETDGESKRLLLQSLQDEVASVGNLPVVIERIRNLAVMRRATKELHTVVAGAYEKSNWKHPENWLESYDKNLFNITHDSNERKRESLKVISKRVITDILEAKRIRHLDSSIEPMNRKFHGYPIGKLTFVAARPGSGKTSLLTQEAIRMAEKGSGVCLFSMEMDRDEITEVILGQIAKVDNGKIQRGELSEREKHKLVHAADVLSRLPIEIIDESRLTVARLNMLFRRACRNLERDHGKQCQVIMIDYLQLMNEPSERDRKAQLAFIVRELRAMVKDKDLCGVVLAQLNREIEKENRPPRLSDIGECGNVEQDAHKIMIITRHRDPTAPAGTVIHIVKNRRGKLGLIGLEFHGPTTTFRPLPDPEQEYYDTLVPEGIDDGLHPEPKTYNVSSDGLRPDPDYDNVVDFRTRAAGPDTDLSDFEYR